MRMEVLTMEENAKKFNLNKKTLLLIGGAAALVLIHPATGEKMRFTCDLPGYYTETLRLLEESER